MEWITVLAILEVGVIRIDQLGWRRSCLAFSVLPSRVEIMSEAFDMVCRNSETFESSVSITPTTSVTTDRLGF
jgi:hypothetical protein